MQHIRDDDNSDNGERTLESVTTGGLSGLVNIGNTCYMNSALQCLSATDMLTAYFISNVDDGAEYKKDLEKNIRTGLTEIFKKNNQFPNEKMVETIVKHKFKNSITYCYRNLLTIMWGENCKVKPKTFKEQLGKKSIFAGWHQHDSQECFSYILDRIHEETKSDVTTEIKNLSKGMKLYKDNIEKNIEQVPNNKYDTILKGLDFWQKFVSKNHSVIIDIFTGIFHFRYECLNCNTVVPSFDAFNIIPLHINSDSLESCLDEYFNDSILDNDNKFFCSNCKAKHDAKQTAFLWHSPPRLVIQMKRFVGMHKNQRHVSFPLENLQIYKYSSDYNKLNFKYELYGVINHSGSLNCGHYTAFTKNPVNGEWYLFDDDSVMHIDKSIVEKTIVTNKAYVLLYKRVQ